MSTFLTIQPPASKLLRFSFSLSFFLAWPDREKLGFRERIMRRFLERGMRVSIYSLFGRHWNTHRSWSGKQSKAKFSFPFFKIFLVQCSALQGARRWVCECVFPIALCYPIIWREFVPLSFRILKWTNLYTPLWAFYSISTTLGCLSFFYL